MARARLKGILFLTGALPLAVTSLMAAPVAWAGEGTRAQHREWTRKLEMPGGTLRGTAVQGREAGDEMRGCGGESADEPSTEC